MRIAALFQRLVDELGARHEAVIVLEEATAQRLSSIAAHFDEEAPTRLVAAAERLSAARRSGLPLQHVIGHWGFRTLDLLQDDRALVVRPETETVVEVALAELDKSTRRGVRSVLDLGTGSGAIALSIASERPEVTVVATDRDQAALDLAESNRSRLGRSVAERVQLLQGDWYTALPSNSDRFDLIVSNPPYVAEGEWALLEPVVREHDPRSALVSGPSGLEAVEEVLIGAPERLQPGASVVCEIGESQGDGARGLARVHGASSVEVLPDLAGRDRVLVVRF